MGTVLCIVLLQCGANPIVTITADHDDRSLEPQTEIQKEGRIQEETQGVFKGEESKQRLSEGNDETKADELQKTEIAEEAKPEENALSDAKRKDRKIKVTLSRIL